MTTRRLALAALANTAAVAVAGCTTPARPTALASRADALLRDLADRQRFQGAVVIGSRARVEYAAGFGFADVQRQIPFTPDTPSDGASIAKTFTAALVLMLAHERRLDLDAPVRSVLPAFPHAATRVRHLLAHAAGLPDYDWFDARVTAGETRTNAGHLALLARDAAQPAFAPGSAFRYDNLAYDAAASVAEQAAGMRYAQLVAQRFAQPLGLLPSTFFVRPARFADWPHGVPRTRGYRRTPQGGWADYDAFDLEGFHGGANIYLSARDLYRWMAGYARVVGAAPYRAAMAPAQLDDGRRTGLTMGSWYVSPERTQRYYTGHHNGFYCVGYADDARDLALAWVANDAPPSWLQPALTRALVALAEDREPERLAAPPPTDDTVDPAGRSFRVPQVGGVRVRRNGKLLRVDLHGVEYDGFPVARGVHYVPGLDAYLRFAPTANGGATMSWDSVFVVAPGLAPLAI